MVCSSSSELTWTEEPVKTIKAQYKQWAVAATVSFFFFLKYNKIFVFFFGVKYSKRLLANPTQNITLNKRTIRNKRNLKEKEGNGGVIGWSVDGDSSWSRRSHRRNRRLFVSALASAVVEGLSGGDGWASRRLVGRWVSRRLAAGGW